MQISELIITAVSFTVATFFAFSAWAHSTLETGKIRAEQLTERVYQEVEPFFTSLDQWRPGETRPDLPEHLPEADERPRGLFSFLREHTGYQQATALDAISSDGGLNTPPTDNILEAVVNILCTYRNGRVSHGTVGSGVVIHPNGVILTNAHIAQFLLLESGEGTLDAECVVRTGSPATPSYRAAVLHIPPTWVYENRAQLRAADPSGTGEQDYALLYITGNIDGGAAPASFPYLRTATEFLSSNDREMPVTIAGYPAEILRTEGLRAPLVSKKADTSVINMFTFSEKKTADLIAVGSTEVGEEGSSGGPVIDKDGRVVGLIVTRGNAEREGERSLRAITLPYIDRTLREETGFGLTETSSGDLARRAEIFESALSQFLSGVMDAEIQKR